MKKVISVLLTLALVLSLGSAALAEEKTTITFWDGNWNEETFKTIQEMWAAENPDIELVGEFQVDNGMTDKYMLALSNGTAADVMACALDWVTTFGNANLLMPLDDFIKADGVDTSIYTQGAIEASTINGGLYGLPFRSETYALFYNKDLLAAAGYTEAPKSWDEVKEIAAACTKDDVAGYGLCGANYGNFSFQYITMLRCHGSDILNADRTESNLNSPEAVEVAKLYDSLKEFAPASLMENDNVANRTLFASGKIAMYLSGIYDVETILAANPDLNFGCALVPTKSGTDADRTTILGGWSVAIPATCKNPEAAWKFVKFLTRSDVAAVYTNTFTGTQEPATKFASFDPEIVTPHQEALKYAKALQSVAKITNIRQAIFDNLQLALTGDLTPEEAIEETSNAVNALIKQ